MYERGKDRVEMLSTVNSGCRFGWCHLCLFLFPHLYLLKFLLWNTLYVARRKNVLRSHDTLAKNYLTEPLGLCVEKQSSLVHVSVSKERRLCTAESRGNIGVPQPQPESAPSAGDPPVQVSAHFCTVGLALAHLPLGATLRLVWHPLTRISHVSFTIMHTVTIDLLLLLL